MTRTGKKLRIKKKKKKKWRKNIYMILNGKEKANNNIQRRTTELEGELTAVELFLSMEKENLNTL